MAKFAVWFWWTLGVIFGFFAGAAAAFWFMGHFIGFGK